MFQGRIVSQRDMEYARLRREREDHINQVIASRKRETEIKRKLLFYLKSEEERLTKQREEEEARKREEAERKKKEEAERQAKLDEIAEKQRQRERELDEKEKQRKEALFGATRRVSDPPTRLAEPVRPSEPLPTLTAVATAAAAPVTSAPGKYIPINRRREATQPPEPERSDRWGRTDDRPPSLSTDRWRPSFGGASRVTSTSSRRV